MTMFTPEALAARESERKARQAQSFEAFMSNGQTKLMVSMIPEGNPPEALHILLRAAFDAGAVTGTADVVGEMVEAMLKSPKFPRD